MTNFVKNEQVKLSATYFNNLAVAAFATGAIIPAVSLSTVGRSNIAIYLPLVMGFGISFLLRVISHRTLLLLKD